jgi:hypothetical protein
MPSALSAETLTTTTRASSIATTRRTSPHIPRNAATHLRQAVDLERALPAGWDHLVDDLPQRVRHVHHLSGRSSQVVALSILGASARLDPSLDWLWEALAPLRPTDVPLGLPRFERDLPPEALNEERGSRDIDRLLRGDKRHGHLRRGETRRGRHGKVQLPSWCPESRELLGERSSAGRFTGAPPTTSWACLTVNQAATARSVPVTRRSDRWRLRSTWRRRGVCPSSANPPRTRLTGHPNHGGP